MGIFDVRDARFSVNRDDSRSSVQYRILAVTFSEMAVGQMFRRNIGSRFAHAIRDEDYLLIKNNFPIDLYGTESCDDVDRLLSAYLDYGSSIGLRNWSPDFRYEVTGKTHRVAQEAERLNLFSEEDLVHVKGIGRKLLADDKLIIPL